MVILKRIVIFFVLLLFSMLSYNNKNRFFNLLNNVKQELKKKLLKRYYKNTEIDFLTGNVYNYTSLVKYQNNKIIISKKDVRAKKTILKGSVLDIINAKNKDTFLEIGSGVGQNLIEIRNKFKNSYLYGCDFSKEYNTIIKVIDNCEIKKINLKEFDSLKTYKTNSIDHVFFSHVIEHILFDDFKKIKKIRSKIFKHMLRIAKKSIIFISDQLYIGHESMKEDIIFVGHKRLILQSDITDFIPAKYKIDFIRADNNTNIFIITL